MNQLLLHVEIRIFFKNNIVKLTFVLSICSFPFNKVVDSKKTPNYCSQMEDIHHMYSSSAVKSSTAGDFEIAGKVEKQ